MSQVNGAREIAPPVMNFWKSQSESFKDFSPKPVPSDAPDVTDEGPVVAPKERLAPESVDSEASPPTTEPERSATPAPAPAASESGQASEPSEVATPESSSPSSSLPTSPGWVAPPVQAKPPTNE